MKYNTKINGIDVKAFYDDNTVKGLFIPLLEHISTLQSKKQGRILVFLAAPPGAGKSTLVSFLEHLAKEIFPENKLQAVGMDGFHRRQEYLLSHTINVNGTDIPIIKLGQRQWPENLITCRPAQTHYPFALFEQVV